MHDDDGYEEISHLSSSLEVNLWCFVSVFVRFDLVPNWKMEPPRSLIGVMCGCAQAGMCDRKLLGVILFYPMMIIIARYGTILLRRVSLNHEPLQSRKDLSTPSYLHRRLHHKASQKQHFAIPPNNVSRLLTSPIIILSVIIFHCYCTIVEWCL